MYFFLGIVFFIDIVYVGCVLCYGKVCLYVVVKILFMYWLCERLIFIIFEVFKIDKVEIFFVEK